MSNELDTSWFDLKKYDELNNLDLLGWHCQLISRKWIDRSSTATWIEHLKEKPIFSTDNHNSYFGQKYYSRYSFNTSSVASTTAAEFFVINHNHLKDVLICSKVYTDEAQELVKNPLNLLCNERGLDSAGYSNYVTVDLTVSDEQIMSDFRHWLTEYRKATGYESKEKNLTDKHLSEWVKYRILPYIDLNLIAQLEGKTITPTEMSKLIFGSEYDTASLRTLRESTKPRVEWLLRETTTEIIEAQIIATSRKS